MEALWHAFGLEAPDERREWDARQDLVRDTVFVNPFDAGFRSRLDEAVSRLAYEHPDASSHSLTIVAEERLRLGALCASKCALPIEGAEADELQKIGFILPRRYRQFAPLRILKFPEGWDMIPSSSESSLTGSSHAEVFDEAGIVRASVFYRHSNYGDSLRGYTSLSQ